MRINYDPDEYETVVTSRPCTSCGGDLKKCNGGCNGYGSLGSRRRSPEEIAAIKAARADPDRLCVGAVMTDPLSLPVLREKELRTTTAATSADLRHGEHDGSKP